MMLIIQNKNRENINKLNFLIAKANNYNLWYLTYRNGVRKYEGTKIIHNPVKVNTKDITLFSICKENTGDLCLGAHENEVYKFNGQSFVIQF